MIYITNKSYQRINQNRNRWRGTEFQKLIEVLELQQRKTAILENEQCQKRVEVVEISNDIHELSERVVEVEKYSRKRCLFFLNLDYAEHPASDILNFMRHYLNVNLSVKNIAVCHPLSYNSRSPMIVNFMRTEI